MPHLWPALRGVLWEYWAALLVGGFWGQCSHGMPHVIRIGKGRLSPPGRAGKRGAKFGARGRGDAPAGDGRDGAGGRGAASRHGGVLSRAEPGRGGGGSAAGASSRPGRGAVGVPGTAQRGDGGC